MDLAIATGIALVSILIAYSLARFTMPTFRNKFRPKSAVIVGTIWYLALSILLQFPGSILGLRLLSFFNEDPGPIWLFFLMGISAFFCVIFLIVFVGYQLTLNKSQPKT